MGKLQFGPFLFGPRLDLLAFGGSAILALGLVLLGHLLGFGGGPLPAWGWVAFVLVIDVGHVYATLFRTYFDRVEVAAHRLRYWGLPIVLYVAMVALHSFGAATFWRVLAYLALHHFVKQQAGWVALYRARAGQGQTDRWIDNAAIYAATLYPAVYWHAHLDEVEFAWFVPGDFVGIPGAAAALPLIQALWIGALVAFLLRQAWWAWRRGTLMLGKLLVVLTTAAGWYVGIVATNNDFDFSVTNVVLHGVPYVVLLWVYASKRAARDQSEPPTLTTQVVSWGGSAFICTLLLLAYAEELAWDRLINHERGWLFVGPEVALDATWLVWVTPLLALPQVTHYALDGLLWRRKDTAQSRPQQLSLGYR